MTNPTNNCAETTSTPFVGLNSNETVPSIDLQALEDRVLYSAGPVPVELTQQIDVVEPDCAALDCLETVETQFDLLAGVPNASEFELPEIEFTIDSTLGAGQDFLNPGIGNSNELVIVDTSVEGYQELVNDLLSSGTAERNLEVVYLVDGVDGVGQVSSLLETRSGLDAVHIVSHGREGELRLGQTTLNGGNLVQFAGEISNWNRGLAEGADILIYGCNVAQSDVGENFVDALSELIDADISASSDITGHQSLGGDWSFEYQVGWIETENAFSTEITETWSNSLAAAVAMGPSPGSTGVDMAADYVGNLLIVSSSDQLVTSDGDDVYLTRRDTTGTDEFTNQLVNDSTAGNQTDAVVAMSDAGDYVVVWTSDAGGQNNIFAKIYDSDGSIEVAEFQVNDLGTTAENAAVSMNEYGEFVIAWEGSGWNDSDGVYAKRFNEYGDELSDVLDVNWTTVGFQGNADVAINNNGQFIVSWDNFYDTDAATTADFAIFGADNDELVYETTAHNLPFAYFTESSVAIDDDLNFVVSATSNPTDSAIAFAATSGVTLSLDVVANAYEYNGMSGWSGVQLGVHEYNGEAGDQSNSSVAIVGTDVFVTWQGEESISGGYPGDYTSVFQRSFEFDGTAVTGEIRMAGLLAEDQDIPSIVSFHNNQSWAMVWRDENGGSEIIANDWSETYTNSPPTGQNIVVAVNEDTAYVLSASDFGYWPGDGPIAVDTMGNPIYQTPVEIEINSLPTLGTLLLNGQLVEIGDEISGADIAAGNFVYLPPTNGAGNTSFDFTVNDGYTDAVSDNTLSITVEPDADATGVAFGDSLFSLDGGILVNDSIVDDQVDHSMAALEGGGYVVVWYNDSDAKIYQQVYDPSGTKLGESQVAGSLAGTQTEPDVAGLSDGGYVVTWSNKAGPARDVYVRRFDAAGNSVELSGDAGAGAPRIANQITVGRQFNSSVSALSDGGFVLAWTTTSAVGGNGNDVAGRTFDGAGGSSDEFLVNQTITSGNQSDVVVEALDGNRFVIGWTDYSVNNHDLFARIFDAGDPNTGSEFGVNLTTAKQQGDLEITALANGNFVASWASDSGVPGQGRDVYATVFDPNGNRISTVTEILINQTIAAEQTNPSIVELPDGGFIAMWESENADADGTAILGRRFDAVGDAVGDEFVINSHRAGDQLAPEAVTLANGQIAVVWGEADGDNAGPGFGYGMFLDRFELATTGNEDTEIPLLLIANLLDSDGSETFASIVISGIPAGAILLDDAGNTTVLGDGSVDVLGWDLATLKVRPVPDSHDDFDLTIDTTTIELLNGDSQSNSQTVHVVVDPVVDAIDKDDFTTATTSDSTTDISAGQLVSGVTNPDLADVTIAPDKLFDSSTLPPKFNGDGTIEWEEASNSTRITFDDGVTYVTDSGSSLPGMKHAFDMDGTVGAEIDQNAFEEFESGGVIELWIRPNSLLDDRVVLDWGGGTEGVAIYQEGSQIVVKMQLASTIDGEVTEPYILVADGLLTSEFNQISVVISTGTATILGDPGTSPDVQLFLNGQLADQMVDLPGYGFDFEWDDIDKDAGLGKQLGSSVGDTGSYGNFAGQVARFEVYGDGKIGASSEVQNRYLQQMALPGAVTIEGQPFVAGTTVTLGSGAEVTVNGDGSLTYDPAGAFDYLASGQLASDSFVYTIENGLGASDLVTVDVNITGINDAPNVTTKTALTVAEGSSGTQITSSMLNEGDPDDDGNELTYRITTNVDHGELRLGGTVLNELDTFTQADINAGNLTYDHDGSETIADGFSFTLADGGEDGVKPHSDVFLINVTPVNDSPVIATNEVRNVVNGSSGNPITNVVLNATDPDDDSAGLTYSITADVTNGTLRLDGVDLATIGSFTQADIDAGRVTYDHHGVGTSDSFSFSLADGGEDGAVARTGVFSFLVIGANSIPVAYDNVYGVAHGGSTTFTIDEGILYNDFDSNGDTLGLTVVTDVDHGTLTLNPDGTFTYEHDGTATTSDSFVYQVDDSNGGTATATVSIHIDDQGFIETGEFQVNDESLASPLSAVQSTAQENGTYADSAVATSANGDYVVVWTGDDGSGNGSVFMRKFDFSGTPIGDSVEVGTDLSSGNNSSANVAMADDGSFVVVWTNADGGGTPSHDGTPSSIYFQRFDANGTPIGVSERVNNASFSAGAQVNADVSMNAGGQFAITWDGAGPGTTHDVFVNVFDSVGTSITAGASRLNKLTGFVEFEYNASVVITDDGTTIGVWDDVDGLHLRAVDNSGSFSDELTVPRGSGVFEARHSSIDFDNDSGLVALAYQALVSDGGTGTQWETHLQVVDPLAPVFFSFPAGSQTSVGDQANPSVSFGSDGTLVMTWQGNGGDDVDGVYARKFRVEYDGSDDPYAQATSDEFLVNETTSGEQTGGSIAVLDSHNFVVAWSGEGVGDSDGIFARQYGNQSGLAVSGQVVEDVNGDADLSDATAFASATVKLYLDSDGVAGASAGDQLVRVTQADAAGDYMFTGLHHDSTYFVVVDSKTIESTGPFNGGYTFEDSWAEQTYGNGGAMIGGRTAGVSDDASSLLTAEHLSEVTIVRNDVANIDFGFSFNVVSNILGGDSKDDDPNANQRSVQGSIRQFITNANAIDGDNHMHFVPMVNANETSKGGDWWSIEVSKALPEISDEGTTLDGQAYEADGSTIRNENGNLLGYSGAVGVGPDGVGGTVDDSILVAHDAPELEIYDSAGLGEGLVISASDVEVSNLAIRGFGENIEVDGTLSAVSNVTIRNNVLGSSADAFAVPAIGDEQSVNIMVRQADSGVIEDNLIGFADVSGVYLNGSNDWQIIGNEIRDNGRDLVYGDGVSLLRGSSNANISQNLIVGNSGYGVDTWKSAGGNSISENTITGNGVGNYETGGVHLYGSDNSVEFNVIADNTGPGVLVMGQYDNGSEVISASTDNLISKNSFAGNTGVAIDLNSTSFSITEWKQGDGVSGNDTVTDITAGNDGLDHPTLSDAYIDASGLHIEGVIESSLNIAQIEFYVADSGSGDFVGATAYGEGVMFLASFSPTDLVSYNATTGLFEALIPTPGGGWPTELVDGGAVTALAIQDLTNNTSEFGNAEEVNVAPEAVDSSILAKENERFKFARTDFDFSDANGTDYVEIIVETIPTGGDLFLGATKLTGGESILASDIDLGLLTYQPDLGNSGVGYDQFEFKVADSQLTSDSSAKMNIDVTDVGSAPTFKNSNLRIDEGELVVGKVKAVDADGDSILYSIAGGSDAGHFFIDSSSGELKFDPTAPDYEAPTDTDTDNVYHVRVSADDGNGELTTQLVRVHVDDVNEKPTAIDDVFTLNEGGSTVMDVMLNDSDIEPFPMTVKIIDGPDHGTAFVNALGNVVYVNDGSEVNFDQFTYRLIDKGGLFDTATVDINITPTDDPTDAEDDAFLTEFEETLVVDQSLILQNDEDPDTDRSDMTVVIDSSPDNGVVSMNAAGELVFIPDAGFSGLVVFKYHVEANGVAGDTAMIRIFVLPPTNTGNEDPVDEEVEEPVDEPPVVDVGDPGGPEPDDSVPEVTPPDPVDTEKLANPVDDDYTPIENEITSNEFQIDSAGTTYAYASTVDDLSLANLAEAIIISDSSEQLSEFESTVLAGLMWEDLDSAKRDFLPSKMQIDVPSFAASAASFLTVGYLAWIIRGGVLLTTFMSSIPAWSSFDIQSILEAASGGDESIEQMVDR